MACKNINKKHRADELRSDVAKAVTEETYLIYHWKRGKHFKTRRDRTIKILPADKPHKGRATVIMKAT